MIAGDRQTASVAWWTEDYRRSHASRKCGSLATHRDDSAEEGVMGGGGAEILLRAVDQR